VGFLVWSFFNAGGDPVGAPYHFTMDDNIEKLEVYLRKVVGPATVGLYSPEGATVDSGSLIACFDILTATVFKDPSLQLAPQAVVTDPSKC